MSDVAAPYGVQGSLATVGYGLLALQRPVALAEVASIAVAREQLLAEGLLGGGSDAGRATVADLSAVAEMERWDEAAPVVAPEPVAAVVAPVVPVAEPVVEVAAPVVEARSVQVEEMLGQIAMLDEQDEDD